MGSDIDPSGAVNPASAGPGRVDSFWKGDDEDRPLTATGRRDAKALVNKTLEEMQYFKLELLNRVEALGPPTLENLSRFIWERAQHAGVDRVVLMLPPKPRDAILPMLDEGAALVKAL